MNCNCNNNYYVDENGERHTDIPMGTSPQAAYARTNLLLRNKVNQLENEMADVQEALTQTEGNVSSQLEAAVDNVNQSIESLSDSIHQDLDEMSENIEAGVNVTLSGINARVDNIIAHNNDTQSNTELIDIRTGVDGTVYASAGAAVRKQIEKTKSNIDAYLEFMHSLGFSDAVVENSEFIQGAYVDSNGYRSEGVYANMRTHNKLLPLSDYIVHLSSYPENMLVSIGLYSDGNGTWLRLYPTLVPIINGEYSVDTEDILTHFPGATHIRFNIVSYADNTYYDISDVKINVYNQQGQTIVNQVEDLSESLDDYGESLDSQNVRLQKLESNKFILPLFNRGYKSINIIGDSISQGAAVSSIPNDSYCGILRKMFSAELGGRLNYGFSAFDKSTDLGFDSSTVTWVYGSPMYGWQRNFADSSVLGGDSYTSSATNSRFCFKLWKNSHYLQIAIVGGSDKGCFELQNGNGNVIAEIDCSTYPQGSCLTDKIDISEIDASNGYEFLIVTKSADTVIISGVSLSDNDDYWTFNNYGRAGASPSVFTGDIFDKESRCSVLIYALGVNSGIDNLNNALASIKNTAKSLNAQKIVLCLCFKGNGFDNRSGGKPQAMKAFSDEIGALFIDVYEHCPKDSNGYPVNGILSQDNIHPTDEGHRFIAELIAKNIGLSCSSKGIVSSMV